MDGWDGHEDESKQKWTFLGSYTVSFSLRNAIHHSSFSSFFARLSFLLDRPHFHDWLWRPDAKDTMGKGDLIDFSVSYDC